MNTVHDKDNTESENKEKTSHTKLHCIFQVTKRRSAIDIKFVCTVYISKADNVALGWLHTSSIIKQKYTTKKYHGRLYIYYIIAPRERMINEYDQQKPTLHGIRLVV